MRYVLLLIAISFIIGSCRKDEVFTSTPVSLNFSTDTVDFDTIFSLKDTNSLTTPKSITLRLIVTNPNENAIKTTVELEGNLLSIFKINADGIPGSGNLQKIENLEIRGKDSVYIFIQTYIKPDLVDGFSVAEKLLFNTNGKQQSVVLLTYALNANYLKEYTFTKDTTLYNINDKPYVIYDDVLVEKGVKLTINPGVKIYSHNNSTIYVAGTLIIDGTVDNPVVLQGDRLDDAYKEVPNQWNGIHLLSTSINNKITGAIIKNGFVGIRVDSLASNANPKLELTQTKIFDMGAVGLLSYSAYIKAENNLISDCGQYTFLGDLGGRYDFTFNTFVALGSSTRQNASFTITNTPYRNESGSIVKVFPLSYNFRNNIIWGSNEDEINFVRDIDGITTSTNVNRNNIKSVVFRDELIVTGNDNQVNYDPTFVDANKKNYKLKGGSPCNGGGLINTGINIDIENKPRLFPPAIGCYEKD
ncbi:MAG: hypothetical protein ACOYMA_08340 [Bacteroidia bacterium]